MSHEHKCCNSDLEDLSEKEKRLLYHYKYLHPIEYQTIYKSIKNKYYLQGYKKYDASKLAKKDTLLELISIDEPMQISKGVWGCPICGIHIKDMGAHIKRIHDMTWECFVDKYSWDSPKIFCDDDHRKNLSENKIHFYNETQSGKNLKSIQSSNVSGERNPACRDSVKLKISKSRIGQHISSSTKYSVSKSTRGGIYSNNCRSYGYTFWTIHNGKEIRLRSKTEYLIFLMFRYYGFDFEYEPYKIEYFDNERDYPRHYIVDFTHKNRLFEVKYCSLDLSCDRKYSCIQEQLSKVNKKLELLTPLNFMDVMSVPEHKQKPISFFNDMINKNIVDGNCKLKIPVMHDLDFYLNSSFIKSLGNNPKEILKKGELLYENKKNSRDSK